MLWSLIKHTTATISRSKRHRLPKGLHKLKFKKFSQTAGPVVNVKSQWPRGNATGPKLFLLLLFSFVWCEKQYFQFTLHLVFDSLSQHVRKSAKLNIFQSPRKLPGGAKISIPRPLPPQHTHLLSSKATSA